MHEVAKFSNVDKQKAQQKQTCFQSALGDENESRVVDGETIALIFHCVNIQSKSAIIYFAARARVGCLINDDKCA